MARQFKRLAPLFVKGSLKAGVYNDGDGLRLIVDTNGAKRWSLRFRWRGREPEMGLALIPPSRWQVPVTLLPRRAGRSQPAAIRSTVAARRALPSAAS